MKRILLFGLPLICAALPISADIVQLQIYFPDPVIQSVTVPATPIVAGVSIANIGPQGPAGAIGVTGATGPTGAPGLAGAQGAPGVTGATGPQGSIGLTGAAGTQGPTGPTGTAGSNGANGAAGPTGTTGPTGAAGSNGTNGTNGAAGPTGAAGSNGTNGTNGAAGAVGPTGPTGAAGSNGTDGTNGTNGTNGATWRSGSGAPSNGTGIDGDFYFRTDTSDVYKRASGTYSVVANIKGATGTAGTNGTNGSNGATGATGPTGPSGSGGGGGPTEVVGAYTTAASFTAGVTTNDVVFQFTIGANETWHIEYEVFLTSWVFVGAGDGTVTLSLTGPAGISGYQMATDDEEGSFLADLAGDFTGGCVMVVSCATGSPGAPNDYVKGSAVVTSNGTGGTVSITWTFNANGKIFPPSCFKATKVE